METIQLTQISYITTLIKSLVKTITADISISYNKSCTTSILVLELLDINCHVFIWDVTDNSTSLFNVLFTLLLVWYTGAMWCVFLHRWSFCDMRSCDTHRF